LSGGEAPRQLDGLEPKHRTGRLNRATSNFSEQLLQQRIAVVANGNVDVGNKTPTRKRGRPIVEHLAWSDDSSGLQNAPQKRERRISGAMSQQRGDSGRGNESAPQKFVQLVGCRDSKARAEPWVRPRPVPAKQ
jgi:hypothetical protein